jgi:hypothetical protein
MPVSKRLRYEVLKRDNHTCRYCGGTAPDVAITVDHVTPVSLGGTDTAANLVACCRDCNIGKSSTSPDAPLVENVKQDAMRWAAAIKLASDRRSNRTRQLNEYCRAFVDEWREYDMGSREMPTPANWQDSIEGFYNAALPISELKRALAISMSKPQVSNYEKFRYMCGICWSVLREIQAEAMEIVAEDGQGADGT